MRCNMSYIRLIIRCSASLYPCVVGRVYIHRYVCEYSDAWLFIFLGISVLCLVRKICVRVYVRCLCLVICLPRNCSIYFRMQWRWTINSCDFLICTITQGPIPTVMAKRFDRSSCILNMTRSGHIYDSYIWLGCIDFIWKTSTVKLLIHERASLLL